MPSQFLAQGLSHQLQASLSACLIVMTVGASFGWVAPSLEKLLRDDSEIPMTPQEASWMVAVIEVGNLLSAVPSGLLADKFGRKPVILFTGPICIISWLIIIKFKTFSALCVARILQGLSIGICYTVVPMYLGEVASKGIRGAITTLFPIAFYLGFLYEYAIGPFVSFDALILLTLCLPVVFLVLFSWQPESPHYYVIRGNEENVKKSLMRLRDAESEEGVKEEMINIIETVKREMSNKCSYSDVISTPVNRRALLIVQVVGAVKILSGLPAIVSYSTDLFSRSGFTAIPPHIMTIIMGAVLLGSVFFSSTVTDCAGRKPLLIISTVGCALSLGSLSVFFYILEKSDLDISQYSWISPICLVSYNLFLAFGLEPVSITYQSEMYPSNIRAVALSINTINFTICAFLTLKLYQTIVDYFGVYFVFLLFSLVCILGSIFLSFFAIETKNKSFATIQEELAKATGT